ncbi:MAG: hypothetical protein CSA35_09045 [Dethiosulfovibrio peptidovorans]|nr:MAG: hypothetical protein CSA35_09045 [Dethiosulfovibrio peptidovorans]
MRKSLSVLLFIALLTVALACTDVSSANSVTLKVGVPKAPPALPFLYMIENDSLDGHAKIELELWDSAEMLIAMVQDRHHHLFAFPMTVISKLYNKGLDIQLLNVNTWGVSYLLTSDPDLKNWTDLKGQTIYVNLQSSPPDALTQYFLDAASMKPGKDVILIYASIPEVGAMAASGKARYAVLLEPMATKALMNNPKLRVAFDFEKEWQKVNGGNDRTPTAGIGATGVFLTDHPELIEPFQEAYREGVEWTRSHPQEIGALAEKYLGLNAELVSRAIPTMGLQFKTALEARDEVNAFYKLLMEFNPKMIGGTIPDKGMFYHAR